MKRLLVGITAMAMWLTAVMSVASAAPPDNMNEVAYWEAYFEAETGHQARCYKHELSGGGHGYVTRDGKGVVLNEFDPNWPGDHFEGLVIKGGSESRTIVVHPESGVRYDSPLNAGGNVSDVSHWFGCKGWTPDVTTTTQPPTTTVPPTTEPPTTTVPPTTQPPTTTVPPTTVPPTTVPPTTVPPTTVPPTTAPPTTLPPETTTTTTPPVTSTTKPPVDKWLTIELSCEWDNKDSATGAHEPIISLWDYSEGIEYGEYEIAYVVYDRNGDQIGSAEFGLTSRGYHDSWVSNSKVPVPTDGFTVDLVINGESVPDAWPDDPTCREDLPPETTTTTSTTVPPTEPICNEDSPSWNVETQDCELPFTGQPLGFYGILGLTLLLLGSGGLAWKRSQLQ